MSSSYKNNSFTWKGTPLKTKLNTTKIDKLQNAKRIFISTKLVT